MTYPPDAFFDIETLINVAQPTSILLLGEEERDFIDTYLEQKALLNQVCSVTQIKLAELDSLMQLEQKFDVCIAINLFEHLDKKMGARILSRLRDVLTHQYCVCLPIDNADSDQSWQLTELFAYALKRVAQYHHNGLEYGLFRYNIDDYKSTPDWLNADNWANPHMWGKYRW